MNFLNRTFSIKNLYLKQDAETGLIAIIAIHNTNLGPALGGCRFVNYPTVDAAIEDAVNLATAMTYKSAMAGLPLGGGKAVVISHSGIKNRRAMFESFADFVDTLQGQYITASDSGTREEDMKVIAARTRFVTSINKSHANEDDTAYMTATGMVRAIKAAVTKKLKINSLDGVHVAIQGIGSVGYLMTKMLLEQGAKISVSDINLELLHQRAQELKVNMVDPNIIAQIPCDVFSPCALGGVINAEVINNLQTNIICGAANNQLSNYELANELHQKNILFVPDYVANAGGVICAAAQAGVITKQDAIEKVENIYQSIATIIDQSESNYIAPYFVANALAEQKFSGILAVA